MQCQKCSVCLAFFVFCKLYFVELAGAMSQVLGVPACHGHPLTCYSTPCSRNATLTFNQIQPEYNKIAAEHILCRNPCVWQGKKQQDVTLICQAKSFHHRRIFVTYLREVCGKSKWKFKMAFAIRRPTRPPPLNGKISRHFFTPLFFFCN